MMAENKLNADDAANRGGSSEQQIDVGNKIFGVDVDSDFAENLALALCDIRADIDSGGNILDTLPKLPTRVAIDINAEVDRKYGQGVARALGVLGIRLTSTIVCGCGKLGSVTSVYYPNMVCDPLTESCGASPEQDYQDLQPLLVAQAVGSITGNTRLATNYYFLEMLGALAGYPYKCACGSPITCLDAPLTCCDFCAVNDGILDFVRHMEAAGNDESARIANEIRRAEAQHARNEAHPVEEKQAAPTMIERLCSGLLGAKKALKDTGSYVYALIAELITTVGNYFNSVFEHYGGQFYEGMKTGFVESLRTLATKLRGALGGVGLLFLFVTVVVATIAKFGASLVANFIINTTLSLFDMLKDIGQDIFSNFAKAYERITGMLRSGKEENEEFVKHAANTDGCIAMLATLFCTLASSSGSVSATNVMRAISSARHVVSGMEVAKSALLWLVECLPGALQTYLWDITGFGSFDCKDEQLKQLIVIMRESLLLLRKNPATFLADESSCKTLLTAHTMLTRAVTRNLHGWNPTQNSIIRAMIAESKEYIARAQATVDRGIGRIEPIGLILQGEPGIGKTALIEVLAAKLNPDVPRCARIYYKNLAEKFWSGYAGQCVLVLDDYGAVKDEQRELGIAADILRIISPGDMALDMPFDKGGVFCESNLVVLTTNRDMNVPQKLLESNRAFMRRFIYCTVEIDDDFKDANGLLDTARLKAMDLEQSLTFPHLKFRIHEKFREGNESRGMYHLSTQNRTLAEVMTVIEAQILKKRADAEFLQDAANASVPHQAKSDVHDQLTKAIVDHIDEDSFDRHMDNGETDGVDMPDLKHVDTPEVKTGDLVLTDSEEHDKRDDGSDHGFGLGVDIDELTRKLADAAIDEVESSHSVAVPVLRRKSIYPTTSGGNKAGKNTRDAIKARRAKLLSEFPDSNNPHYDEYGIPWASSDIAMRAANFLSTHSAVKHVKPVSLREQTERFKQVMCESAMEVFAKIKDHPIKCIATVTACAATIALCIKAFKLVMDPTHEPQMRTKYNQNIERRRPEIAHRHRFAPVITRHSLESATDQGVINKIAGNCGYLERKGGKVGCMFVKGNVFRTVVHFFRTSETSDRWLPDGTPFSVFAREGNTMVEYKMTFSMDFVIPFEDEATGLLADWLYYNCGTAVPPKKDLTSLHVSEKLFTHRRDFRNVMMVRPDGLSKGTTGVVRHIANSPAVQYSSIDGSKKPDVYVPRAIMSNYDCKHGDCGFPIIGVVEGQFKILALHVGVRSRPIGSDSTSAVVTRSEVNDCLDKLDRSFPITKHAAITDVIDAKPGVKLNDSYTYCGQLTWAPKGISSNTKYKKSLIYDTLPKEVVYEPSIMGNPDDVRTSLTPKEVLAEIANRADASLALMPKDLVLLAEEALFQSIITEIPVIEQTKLRVLSLEEALNGDGNLVDSYPTAGSPGLPSTVGRKPGVTGKHGIMGQNSEGVWVITDPDCAERIEDMHKSFSDGKVAFHVNQLCIKDETLKTDEEGKVKKTRGIKCASFESNVCGKRYFGAMVGLFKKFYDKIPFKCGINVFSSDWDDLIKYHLEVGDFGFDGDIGGQENIITSVIYDSLYRFAKRIYAHYGEEPTEEENRQRASYLASLCHYYMVIGPDLFRAKFGNPSGNWLTSFICSYTSGILLGVAYFGLARIHDPLKANVYHFLSLVRMSLAGDDNLVSRSCLVDWFSGANVSAFLKENYGYKYTDAKKAAVYPPDCEVIKLSFLACTTRLTDRYPGINYLARIDKGPLNKCVQYISKKASNGDEYIAIADNANTALDLVFTSGEERFEKYKKRFTKAFVDAANCKLPVLHDFAYCEERFLRRELLSEDYTNDDDYKFIPQMLKAPEQVEADYTDAQVSVKAGVDGPSDPVVTYKPTESTVLEPSKRFAAMYYSPELKTPVSPLVESVSAAFLTRTGAVGEFKPMAGALAWYAGPFAAWTGDLRLAVKCAGETLIRTDATERLANSSNIPKQIANGLSSMAPFDFTSAKNQWAMLQIPQSFYAKVMVLPKLQGEEKYRQTTPASYIIDVPYGADRPDLTVFAAAGDNFAFHFLFMVPAIKVGTEYYPHNRNYEDALPEYLQLTNVPGAPPFPFAQATVLFNYKQQGEVVSAGASVASIRYRTELFDNNALISLGVVTSPGPVNRRYDPGAVRLVECDMKYCVARSINIEVRPGGASSGAVAFNLDPTAAVVRGTSYTSGSTEMAEGWFLTYLAYNNSIVRGALNNVGISSSEIVIPAAQSGYTHSPAESFITPTTNTGVAYAGGDYFTWDSTASFPKAFYYTSIIPFKEDHIDAKDMKEDYAFVKHMQSDDHGIGFTNVVEGGSAKTDRQPNVARKLMGEEKYSFDSVVGRWQLMRSTQWTTQQVQGTVIDQRSVPFDCIATTTRTSFEKFCYFAGDVEVKLQVQSTAFVCGKLTLVFAPFCDPARASYLQLPSLTSISVAPNVSLMAGNTTDVTMLIPFAHYKNYLNTDGQAGDPFGLMGTISTVVFNKLRAAPGGVDYCTVNIYTRMINCSFQMLRPPPSDGNVPVFTKHGGAMSVAKNVTGVIDDVTDAVSKVSSVTGYALDAPNVGLNFTPVLERAAPMMNHHRNIKFLNVMDLDPGQQSMADEKDVSSKEPECSLKYLLTKPSYLNTFSIKESDLEGEVYFVAPLTPTMKLFNAPMTSMVQESLAGYVAAPFKYWRGGFKFIIEFIATSVHTVRLVVATHYGGSSSTVSMDNIFAQNAEVLEVGAGQNTFEVIVPWRCPTQWLEVPGGPPEKVNPFEVTSSARYTMGEVSIRLLTRLQTMPSIPTEIDANVYMCMLDDAELTYLGMNTADLVPVFVPNQDIVPP